MTTTKSSVVDGGTIFYRDYGTKRPGLSLAVSDEPPGPQASARDRCPRPKTALARDWRVVGCARDPLLQLGDCRKDTVTYPRGKRIYRTLGRAVRRNQRGTGVHIATAYPIIRKARDLAQGQASILDVGTGWFHHDAFLLYLVAGERWQIALFDIEDRGDLRSIRNYLSYLRDNSREVAAELELDQREMVERLDELLALPTREQVYERCGFTLHIPSNLTKPFLPDKSFDVMVSDCVLSHIRPEIVVDELSALGRMLKDEGVMYHRIGHDDHWAFHDPTIPWPSFNYLRYSDRTYRLLFDTKLEYHNRLLRSDWLRIFDEAGLRVIEYDAKVSNASRDAVNRLPKIADKYAGHPEDELAVYYSYVLLGRGDAKASS